MIVTRKAIQRIREKLDALEKAINQDGVPVDAALYFAYVSEQSTLGAAESVRDAGKQ